MNTRRKLNRIVLLALVLVLALVGQVANAAHSGTDESTGPATTSRISEAYYRVKMCQADLADASLRGEGAACLDAVGRGWRARTIAGATSGDYYDMKERQADWMIQSR